MSRPLLVALTALSLAAAAPAGARNDHPPTAKQRAAAQRHALVRR
ncbi:MAG: hypothetical protein JWM73_147, partial [Solirubrobacterales bacterium]|nr:hypothetical protein [Solirubrobacterales bacterium]